MGRRVRMRCLESPALRASVIDFEKRILERVRMLPVATSDRSRFLNWISWRSSNSPSGQAMCAGASWAVYGSALTRTGPSTRPAFVPEAMSRSDSARRPRQWAAPTGLRGAPTPLLRYRDHDGSPQLFWTLDLGSQSLREKSPRNSEKFPVTASNPEISCTVLRIAELCAPGARRESLVLSLHGQRSIS